LEHPHSKQLIFQSHIINPEILVSSHLPEKLNPWESEIRQAILKGTANIIEKMV
jgi:hypothetical protein